MKYKLYSIVLIAMLAVGSVFCWNVYAQKKQSPTTVWEYNIVATINGDNRNQLSELGNDGWELTSVRTEDRMIGNFREQKVFYYLKRPKELAK